MLGNYLTSWFKILFKWFWKFLGEKKKEGDVVFLKDVEEVRGCYRVKSGYWYDL